MSLAWSPGDLFNEGGALNQLLGLQASACGIHSVGIVAGGPRVQKEAELQLAELHRSLGNDPFEDSRALRPVAAPSST